MKIKSENKSAGYGTVSLPLPLIEKIKKKIEGTGMNSVSAYVSFVLRNILSSPEKTSAQLSSNKSPLSPELMDKRTEEELRIKLKNLGYA